MNKKIKKTLVILLLILVLTSSALIPKIKLDFHRKHVKQHKHRIAKIKAIDTLQINKDIMRLKLFTRQQWLKKRKLEAKKAEEKREQIKKEHQIKLNKEREAREKKKQQEKPYEERWITVTAYTNKGGAGHGITASGARTQEGVTLAAPSWVEMGSVVEINNHRYTVQDRGGKIQGGRFDLYIADEQRAIEFGVKRIKAKIYKN
jgi:3D (Asp-Asp-Asp) domain-containing protein